MVEWLDAPPELVLYWMSGHIPEATRTLRPDLDRLNAIASWDKRYWTAARVLERVSVEHPEWVATYEVYRRLTSGRKT